MNEWLNKGQRKWLQYVLLTLNVTITVVAGISITVIPIDCISFSVVPMLRNH